MQSKVLKGGTFCFLPEFLFGFIKNGESESVSCSVTSDFATPWTVACQAPLSMEFSRQEYWSV